MALDPLNRSSHDVLGFGLYFARRYEEAIRAYAESITLDPAYKRPTEFEGLLTMGSMTLRTHAPHVRPSRTTG
jgi:hypothetical protein